MVGDSHEIESFEPEGDGRPLGRVVVRTALLVSLLLLAVSLMSTAARSPADTIVPWLEENTSDQSWLPRAFKVSEELSPDEDRIIDGFDRLRDELDSAQDAPPSFSTVRVDMTSTKVVVTVSWEGPTQHPLLRTVLRGATIDLESRFVAEALARVEVSRPIVTTPPFASTANRSRVLSPTFRLTPELNDETSSIVATWTIDRALPSLQPGEESVEAFLRETRVSIDPPRRDDLGVTLTAIMLTKPASDAVDLSSLPTAVTSTEIVYSEVEAQRSVFADVVPPRRQVPSVESTQPTSAGGVAVDWAGERRPGWIRGLVFEVLVGIPFLLALWWVRGSSVSARTQRAIQLLAVLQVISGAARGLAPIVDQLSGLLNPAEASSFEAPWNWWEAFVDDLRRYGLFSYQSQFIVGQIGFSIGWPIAVRRLTSHPSWSPLGVFGCLVSVGAAMIVLVIGLQRASFAGLALLTAAFLVVVAVLCVLIARPFLGWRASLPAGIVAASLSLLLVTTDTSDFRSTSGLPTTIGVIVALAVGLPVVAAFVRAAVWIASERSVGSLLLPGRVRFVGLLLAAPIAAYVLVPRQPESTFAAARLDLGDLSGLAFALRSLLALVLVAVVVRELARRRDVALGGEAFWPFAAIATVIIFPTTLTFWFVPVVASLGLIGLWWLARRHTAGDAPLSLADRARVVQTIIDVRRLQRAIRTLQRRGLDKVVEGERKIDDVDTARGELEKRVAYRMTAGAAIGGAETLTDLELLAAAQPPGASPWESAKIGARFSFLLGLMWIVVYWRGALLENWTTGFIALGLVNDLVRIALVWTLFGFVLGYFFRAIPGRNGIVKGLVVALGVVGPWVVYSATYAVPAGQETWGERLVWVVLVLAHMVFVGLALDAVIVRGSRLPGSALVELRGLRPLIGYGSALVAALGGVLTAVVTTSATTILAAGLAFLAPEAPAEPQAPVPTVPARPADVEVTD